MDRTIAPPPSAETYSALGPMSLLPGADDVEVDLTRVVPASREDVYDAFTDPELLQQWWGPAGYTVTSARTDARPGGRYALVMQAPDGTEYPVTGSYIQAERADRIVMTDEAFESPQDWQDLLQEYRGEEETPLRLIIRVLLEDTPDGTALTIVSRFPRVDDPLETLGSETSDLWNASLDRLEGLLGTRAG